MAVSAGVTALHLSGDLGFFAGGMNVSRLIGTFVKSISATGLVTFQAADGSERTLQLPSGGGSVHVPTAVDYSSGAGRITVTTAANAAAGDLVAFEVPSTIDDGTDDLVLRTFDGSTNGPSLAILDLGGDNVTAANLSSGQALLAVRQGSEYRLLTALSVAGAASWDTLTGKAAARPSRAEIVAGTSETTQLWAPEDIAAAVDAHDSSLIGPFHFRINENATQTDSQAAHFLGGIYRNISGRPLRVLEAFIPVHPDGGGTVGYNAYVWRLNRVSATSYLTPTTDAGNVENLRTARGGSNIEFDVPAGQETEIHGYSPLTVVIEPDDYFAVAVDRVINGTNANTIVASGADVDEDFDNAIEYVAKASFAATFSVNRGEELYHNSSFAERMRLIFEFADGGVLPPIHGIQTEGVPEGTDKLPFSNERASGTPNEYIEWADAVDLIRNVSVYERSRPQASVENLHDVVISAVDRSADICLNIPHRTTESTGTWAAITPGTNIEYARVRGDATPVQSRYLYEYFTDDFWFGADLGGGTIAWVQDDADDALAAFLTSGIDRVQWLHHHASDDEALAVLPTLPATHEAFYWNTGALEIRKLDSSTFVPAGSPGTAAHYVWVELFAGDPQGEGGGGTGSGEPRTLYEDADYETYKSSSDSTTPTFRAVDLSEDLPDTGQLLIEFLVEGEAASDNTPAIPVPDDAFRILYHDPVFVARLKTLQPLTAAQIATSVANGSDSPIYGTIELKSGRGDGRDVQDFAHSSLYVGWAGTADPNRVYIGFSQWGALGDHILRVSIIEAGGSSQQQAGGGAIERTTISEGFELATNAHSGQFTGNLTRNAVTFAGVPKADILGIALTFGIQSRFDTPIYLDRSQLDAIGYDNTANGWPWSDNSDRIPALYWSGNEGSTEPRESWIDRPSFFQVNSRRQSSIPAIFVWFRDNTDDEFTGITILVSGSIAMHLRTAVVLTQGS